jgi:hypothetical protein
MEFDKNIEIADKLTSSEMMYNYKCNIVCEDGSLGAGQACRG